MADSIPADTRDILNSVGVDFDVARKAIKAGESLDSIVNSWLDDSEGFRKKYDIEWDESAFSANRDGSNPAALPTTTGPTFQVVPPPDDGNKVIDGRDPNLTSYFDPTSRPPSRNQSRSPIGGPMTKQQEDDDLQRALRESATAAGVEPQETGVVTYFGPATKEAYDASEWSMIKPLDMHSAVAQLVPPSARKREQGAPLLLYSEGDNHDMRLGAFLSILSEIPLARNSLLALDIQREIEYPADWWKGQAIGDAAAFFQLVQTLVGACDSSERSYIMIEPLGEFKKSGMLLKNASFFETILGQPESKEILARLLHTLHEFTIDTAEDEDHENQGIFTPKMLLTVGLPSIYYKPKMSLYEVLDHFFWRSILDGPNFPSMESQNMTTLSTVGEVFMMQCDPPFGASTTARLAIPQYFYPERYLEARKQEAIGFQYLWKKTKRHIEAVAAAFTADSRPAMVERVTRLKARLEASEAGIEFLSVQRDLARLERMAGNLPQPNTTVGDGQGAGSSSQQPEHLDSNESELRLLEQVRQQSEKELEASEARLKELEDRLKQYTDVEEFLSTALTDPDGSTPYSDGQSKKYLLRGVIVFNGDYISATTRKVFVCRRNEVLIDLEGGGGSMATDEWWQLEYIKDGKPVVKAELVAIDKVLNAALDMQRPEQASIGLVYASEDSLNQAKVPIPGTVNRFLRLDHRRFREELAEEESKENPVPSLQQEAPPLPPRTSPPTPSSMNTNRGSMDDDIDLSSRDGDFEHEINAFADQDTDPAADRVTEIRMTEVDDAYDMIPDAGTTPLAPAPAPPRAYAESPILGRVDGVAMDLGDDGIPAAATTTAQVGEGTGAIDSAAGLAPPPYAVATDLHMTGMTPESTGPMEEMKDVSTKPLFLASATVSDGSADKRPSSMDSPEGT